MVFQGTNEYVATDDLQMAVNAAISLEKPLLIKGEPGTGKTMLAEQLSESNGISSQPQKLSKVFMSMTLFHACVIRSLEMTRFMIFRTTL
jgi:MoxR-like ATPase